MVRYWQFLDRLRVLYGAIFRDSWVWTQPQRGADSRAMVRAIGVSVLAANGEETAKTSIFRQ